MVDVRLVEDVGRRRDGTVRAPENEESRDDGSDGEAEYDEAPDEFQELCRCFPVGAENRVRANLHSSL